MLVPNIDGLTIVNKEIVYDDEISLYRKYSGYLKETCIDDIGEDSLSSCLNEILKSNLDVEFDTIKYSPKYRKLYFYTKKKISIDAWKNVKNEEIINEINRLLDPDYKSDFTQDSRYISLYDVTKLMYKIRNHNETIKKRHIAKCENILRQEYMNSTIYYCYIDDSNNTLKLEYTLFSNESPFRKATFSVINDDLYVSDNSEPTHTARELLNLIGNELLELYKNLIKVSKYDSEACFIETSNSDFYVELKYSEAKLCANNKKSDSIDDFSVEYGTYVGKYAFKCNSLLLSNTIKNKEEELFKRIYLKIDDCPKWCIEELKEIRQKQLSKPKKSFLSRLIRKTDD